MLIPPPGNCGDVTLPPGLKIKVTSPFKATCVPVPESGTGQFTTAGVSQELTNAPPVGHCRCTWYVLAAAVKTIWCGHPWKIAWYRVACMTPVTDETAPRSLK